MIPAATCPQMPQISLKCLKPKDSSYNSLESQDIFYAVAVHKSPNED